MTPTTTAHQAWAAGAAERGWRRRMGRFGALVAQELAPRPGRVRSATRSGLITALGAGLMAALQINTPLGPYVLWSLAGGGPMLSLRTGARFIVLEALALSASVPLAALLLEAPWLLVPGFALVSTLMTYILVKYKLGSGWLMLEVTFLTTFYESVYDPHGFGQSVAFTFAGSALAFALATAFDGALWPAPAEPALLDELAGSMRRRRRRLEQALQGYLGETAAPELAAISSTMPAHLPLLSRAEQEGMDAAHHAVLLAAISIDERLFIEVERLAVLARAPVPRALRREFRDDLEAVAQLLDRLMAEEAGDLSAGLPAEYLSHERSSREARVAAARAEAMIARLTAMPTEGAAPAELSNLAGFIVVLQRMALLFQRIPEKAAGSIDDGAAGPAPITWSPAEVSYCVKMSVAMTVAYVVGIASHRPELEAILWSVAIAGLPTYGATLRKMTLRMAGAVLGGMMAIAAMIVVSPNVESVGGYMGVLFVALTAAAYVGLSSGRVAYAGRQAGISFVITYVALHPSDDVYGPLWRVWAISLGLLITTASFLYLWPDYAGRSMVERIKRALRSALVLPRRGATLAPAEIEATESNVINVLTQLLGVADDARMEGRRSGLNGDAIVEAAGTLRRIVNRLSSIAGARAAGRQLELSGAAGQARAAFESALAEHLQYWLDYFESLGVIGWRGFAGKPRPAPPSPAELARALAELNRVLAANDYAVLAAWPSEARASMLSALDSYGRIAQLAADLDLQLDRVIMSGE